MDFTSPLHCCCLQCLEQCLAHTVSPQYVFVEQRNTSMHSTVKSHSCWVQPVKFLLNLGNPAQTSHHMEDFPIFRTTTSLYYNPGAPCITCVKNTRNCITYYLCVGPPPLDSDLYIPGNYTYPRLQDPSFLSSVAHSGSSRCIAEGTLSMRVKE